jgi:hypothetical protein
MPFRTIIATPYNEDEANYLRQIADALERKKRTRLDALDDVVEAGVGANNQTLVYDSESDKYKREHINVDGGSFDNPPFEDRKIRK